MHPDGTCTIGMCGIDIFYFGSVSVRFVKKDLVRNEFGSVRFKKCGSVLIVIYYSHNSNITATVDDMTLMSLTTTKTSK